MELILLLRNYDVVWPITHYLVSGEGNGGIEGIKEGRGKNHYFVPYDFL